MRPFVEKVKEYYEKGIYTITNINRMLLAGKITQAEYEYIVNEETERKIK